MTKKKLIIFFQILMVTYPVLSSITGINYPKDLMLNAQDSINFRTWFVAIALDNIVKEHPTFKTKDCSGFIFYCLKEALKKHDKSWFSKTGYGGPIFEDVKKYNYPNTPYGINIFSNGDKLVSYVNAYNLITYNTDFISYDRFHAKPGDLVFFLHPQDPEYPFHVMIYTGKGYVYHTGPDGQLRYVSYENLMLTDIAWRPIKLNPNFLGYYRLKFLSD
ncbi:MULTISPECIES: DUF1175 family protein [unclassified Thermosipho (in: thermotogales)]|uniref:DUF1175 domain-containing protein n=1 Tax=unclassified Thermosipho (in: thermotogales) TaxID=2676525 RepID=UPI000987BA50|nr:MULTISPECIES: DUF1175 family protein [unclassified Thermosipho (in: thermotogales)]